MRGKTISRWTSSTWRSRRGGQRSVILDGEDEATRQCACQPRVVPLDLWMCCWTNGLDWRRLVPKDTH